MLEQLSLQPTKPSASRYPETIAAKAATQIEHATTNSAIAVAPRRPRGHAAASAPHARANSDATPIRTAAVDIVRPRARVGRRRRPAPPRNVRVLELPVRVRHVVARDTEHGPSKVEDRLLREDGSHLGCESANPWRLLDDDRMAGLGNRCEQAVLVQRLERAEIQDLARRLAGERLRDTLGHTDHRPVRDDRHVGTLAGDARLAERHDVLALGDVATREPIDQLRLEHDHGIGIADRRSRSPFASAGVDGIATFTPGVGRSTSPSRRGAQVHATPRRTASG